MSQLKIASIAKNVQRSLRKHSPEILISIGIAGMLATTVMAVRATPKAIILIEETKKERGEEKLPAIESVKVAWKCYIPAAITGVASIACLVGASSVNTRRNTALATAYSISESALMDYQNKVVEAIGEKHEKEIRDSIAKDKLEKRPVSSSEVIITGKGDTLCFDSLSGRYFESDIDKIKKAVNDVNRTLISEMYLSLNDFYYALGLGETKIGEDLGWNVDKGLIDVSFTSQLAEDNTPCLVINYTVAPRYDYYR